MKKFLFLVALYILCGNSDAVAKKYHEDEVILCNQETKGRASAYSGQDTSGKLCDFQKNLINGTIEWNNGGFVHEISYIDGMKNGIEKHYDALGELESETPYKNGVRDGIEKEYSRHGYVWQETSYKDGKWHGSIKRYRENNQLREEIPYENGLLNGIEKEYYENGQLLHEVPHKDGKTHGVEKWYRQDGSLETEIEYEWDEAISGYRYSQIFGKRSMTDKELKCINAYLHRYVYAFEENSNRKLDHASQCTTIDKILYPTGTKRKYLRFF